MDTPHLMIGNTPPKDVVRTKTSKDHPKQKNSRGG